MPSGKPKSGGARIRWTDTEHDALLQAAVQLLRDKQADNGIDLIVKAQQALPKERWRPRPSLTTVAAALLKEARAALNKVVPPPPAISLPPADEPPRRRASDLDPPPPAPTPVEAFVEIAGGALAQILVYAFRNTDVIAAARGLFAPAEHAMQAAAAVHYPFGIDALRGGKKPKVLIAGLKGNQAEALKPLAKELGLNTEFWSKDESTESLRQLARHSDAAIGVVSFIAHSHDQILKTGAPRYMRVPGGVSAIAEKLRAEFPLPVAAV